MGDASFKIVKNLITLQSSSSFHKELNLVSWNKREPVYDLRGWNEDHTKMTKGITLSEAEFQEFISKIKEEF